MGLPWYWATVAMEPSERYRARSPTMAAGTFTCS